MKLTETIDTEYKDISTKEIMQVKKEEHTILDTLIETCFRVLDAFDFNTQKSSFQYSLFLNGELYDSRKSPPLFSLSCKELSNIEYTQEDITSFCIKTPLFFENKNAALLGTFISALINIHFTQTKTDKAYEIPLDAFPEPIHYLGLSNKATYVNIRGTAGTNIGHKMEQGRITLFGDAGNYAGKFKKGGFLNIFGNAGNYLGHHMTGGMIRVSKNAGENVGEGLKCGTIYVGGKIKSIGINKMTGEIIAGGIKVFERK